MEKLSLGEFLSILRKGKGLKQEDVADKLGVSAKTISSWENNRTYPDIVMLPIIADLFDVTVDELVRGSKSNTINTKEEPEVLDKKNITKIRKVKYAKYKESCLFLTISLILNSFVSVLGIYLMCFIATWTLVFAVVGGIGFVISLVVLVQNEHHYFQNEGILTREDYVQENYLTIISCKLNTLKCIVLGFIPFLIYGIVINCIYGFNQNVFIKNISGINIDMTSGVLTYAIISLILGLLGIIVCFILYIVNSRKYGNEQGKLKFKKNIKLSIILASIMSATMILCPIITSICDKFGPIYDYYYAYEYNCYDTSEELIKSLNIYTVDSQELVDAGLTMGQEIVLDYTKVDYFSNDKIVNLSNGFYYLSDFSININSVYLYEKDPTSEYNEYLLVDEVSDLIKNAYFNATNRDNISVYFKRWGITFNIPNELIYFDYDINNKVYYLNFVVDNFFDNNGYKLVVDENEKITHFYSGLYYCNNENLPIEEWVQCDWYNDYILYFEEINDDPDVKNIPYKWIPVFKNPYYTSQYLQTLEENSKEFTERVGYIICGPNKGKYGHYGYSYHYLSENKLLIETVTFLFELTIELAIGIILWKKEKYEIDFKK